MIRRFIGFALEFSLPLLAGVFVAVAWANIDLGSYHHLLEWSPLGEGSELNFHFLVNDIFMVFFFGTAAGEIVEACLPGGALNPPRRAVNPLLATLGGVLGPALVYVLVVTISGRHDLLRGWGVPTATDIAVAWLFGRVVFGKRHPAVAFLLLLAIADDAVGLVIIAIFYPDPSHPVSLMPLLMVAGAMILAWAMLRVRIKSFWPYVLGAGGLAWTGLHLSGIHPALALVAVVPFMPHMSHDVGLFEDAEIAATDALNKFQGFFSPIVAVGLFAFGLANAGVAISESGVATLAVLIGLAVGKTFGITLFGFVARMVGFPLPDGMKLKDLPMAAFVAGLGLTVALFVAGVAYPNPEARAAAKLGALMSLFIGPIAILVSRAVGIERIVKRTRASDRPGTPES